MLDDIEATANSRVQVDNLNNKTILVIQECCREDSGKYNLLLENGVGESRAFISLKVLDTPGAVAPSIKNIARDHVVLLWTACQNDGGSEVFSYQIEKKEASQRTWSICSSICTKTSFKV